MTETELIIAAWAASVALLFLPLRTVARLIGRRLRPAAPEADLPPEAAVVEPPGDPGSGDAAVATTPPPEAAVAGPPRPLAVRALRLLGGPTTVVLYVVFIAGAIYLAPRLLVRVLDTDHPMAAITSQSMYPLLKRGDIVLLQGVEKAADLNVGDIIAYNDETSGLILHRIIIIDGEEIITQGDANLEADDPITFDQLVGRTLSLGGRLARIPYVGNIPILFGASSDVDDGQAATLPPEDIEEDSSLADADAAPPVAPVPDGKFPDDDRGSRPLGP